MKTYEQVLEIVELALSKGEYNFCIEFLSPIIESFPLSSEEGVNLRTILITAFCGINKKEEAKKFCKELLKSYKSKTRENAKYLMEIIDSPEIKKPKNWNIDFERNSSLKKKSLNYLKPQKSNLKKKKFININDVPTGETKSFQNGFAFTIGLILFLLILLLSGCVRVENTLDLSQLESINNSLKIESKYIQKFPWQYKFEERMKDIFPDAEIAIGTTNFSIKNKNLTLGNAKEILQKIQESASDLAGISTFLDINTNNKNFIFLEKYYYKIDFDLQMLSDVEDLELYFKIINPNKTVFNNESNTKLKISKNLIVWNLIPGEKNSLEFSFWRWNKILIWTIIILLLMTMAYILRSYRYKLGSDLPQLPSD